MLTDNLKSVLPSKLWRAAESLISFYENKGFTISQAISIDENYRYRTHIVCRKRYETIAVELRERCNIESPFERFVLGCQANQIPVKIFFAVPSMIDDTETLISHNQRNSIKKTGIGLIIVGDEISEEIGTISCNRRFVLDPGTSLGKYASKVDKIIQDYNFGNCLEAVKNLTEEAEDATVALVLKAIKLGKLNLTVQEIDDHDIDWAGMINCLAQRVWKGTPQTQIINDRRLKNSLDNFRDKRNLSHHRKTAKQLRELEQQYPEAMHQGIRLLRELVKMKNQLK